MLRLAKKISFLTILNRMKLSPDQLKRIYAGAVRAAKEQERTRKIEDAMLKEMLEAYTDFREEDIENKGFSQEVEGRTARVHGREMQLRKETSDRINVIEKDMEKILTKTQLALIEEYRTGVPDSAVLFRMLRGLAPRATAEPVDQLVKDVRAMPDDRYERMQVPLTNRLGILVGISPRPGGLPKSVTRQLRDALDEIRDMDEEDLEVRVPKILEEIKEKAKPQQLNEKLHEAYGARYGRIGPLGHFLIYEEAVPILKRRVDALEKKDDEKEEGRK